MEEIQNEIAAPSVTALIVTRDCVQALRQTVTSLEAASGRERLEILVVDNGSGDGCGRIDREFPNVTVMRLPHHCGLTKARNIGIRTAKGDYLLLLAAGVTLAPEVPLALAERLEATSAALAVSPLLMTPEGAVASRAYKLPTADQIKAHWSNPASLPSSEAAEEAELADGLALCIRKNTIRGINYLDERFGEFWGDVDLAWQIRRAGKKIIFAHDLKGVVAADSRWQPAEPDARTALVADAASGAAELLGKQTGFMAGLMFRIGHAVKSALTGKIGLASSAFGGKLDGSEQRL